MVCCLVTSKPETRSWKTEAVKCRAQKTKPRTSLGGCMPSERFSSDMDVNLHFVLGPPLHPPTHPASCELRASGNQGFAVAGKLHCVPTTSNNDAVIDAFKSLLPKQRHKALPRCSCEHVKHTRTSDTVQMQSTFQC